MVVPSLYTIAKSRLIANIHLLDDIGDLPYSFMAPVIRHIQSPAQLQRLEDNCPQLCGETGDIWLRLIKRDIPNWETKPHQPRDPKNWSKVYRKLHREAIREKEEAEERLKQEMRALRKDKQETTLILEGTVAGRRAPVRKWGSSGWGSSGAPAKTGKGGLDVLKRTVFDSKQIKPKAMHLPAKLLAERRGQVKEAPQRMVRLEEFDRAGQGPSAGVKAQAQGTKTTAGVPQRPAPKIRRSSAASPEARSSPAQDADRPRLPPGQQFRAPKLKAQPVDAPVPQKRRKEEPNVFMAKKRKT